MLAIPFGFGKSARIKTFTSPQIRGKVDAVLKFIRARKHKAWLIGEVVKGKGKARVV